MSSDLYTVTKHTTAAAFPRARGGTLLTNDRLEIAYLRFSPKLGKSKDPSVINIDLVFSHGTGMNKSIWKYHIDQLYKYAAKVGPLENWKLNRVISIDAVSHGDSALINHGKLGWSYRWEDGAKDVIAVIKAEQLKTGDFVNDANNKTIMVGHSLGASQSLLLSAYEPFLLDTAFAIEPVAFIEESDSEKFTNIIRKMGTMIKDEFESEGALEKYMTKYGFLRNFDPRVLKDVIEDEKYDATGSDGIVKFKTKSSTAQQLATYMTGFYSIPLAMSILPTIRSNVVHVAGKKATWNPPKAVPFIRNTIPKEFVTGIDIEDGEHLVNGERPDEIISEISKCISDRVKLAHKNRDNYPEIKYHGQRDEILTHQWQKMLDGKIEDAIDFTLLKF